MFKKIVARHLVVALAIASALAVGIAPRASASLMLGVEFEETGYTPFSMTSGADPLIVSKNFGTFSTNVEVNNVTTDPLSIDLGSLNVSTNTGGTLTIVASATGLTSPLGAQEFISQFSGNFNGAVSSTSLQTYISNSNTMFGTDTLLSSLGNGTSSPFATTANGYATTTDPFSISEVLTIKTTGAANFISLDASAAAAPEIDAKTGGAAIALLIGVFGLLGDRRRRPAAIA